MSSVHRLRRLLAINSRWVLAVLGAAAIVFSPFAAAMTNLPFAAMLLVVGAIALSLSIEMARSLDIQRRLRRLEAAKKASTPRQSAALPQERSSVPVVPRNSGVTPGRLVAGHGTDRLPVIAFDLTGMSEDQIRCAVESTAAHQLITGSFKPVFVMDRPEFSATRAYGYLAELVVAPEEWRGDQAARTDYLRRRLDSILAAYGCAAVIRPRADGLGEVGRLLIERVVASSTNGQIELTGGPSPNSAARSRAKTRTDDAVPTTGKAVMR